MQVQERVHALCFGSTHTSYAYLLLQLVEQRLHQDKMTEMVCPNLQLKVVFGVSKRRASHTRVQDQHVNATLRQERVSKASYAAQVSEVELLHF